MKIKMLMSISGVGFALARGDETDRFPEKDALSLIGSGAAVLVVGSGYETAVTDNQTTETAVAALNIGTAGQGGQEPVGSGDAGKGAGETGAENAGATGDDGGQDGHEPVVTGDGANTAGESGTNNAGADATGSGDQADAAQSVSGKGKGKAG